MESKQKEEEEEDNETWLYATQLAGGSVLPMVVKSVIELGIFEILAGDQIIEGLSGIEIAAKLEASNNNYTGAGDMIDRMLRLLACCSVVKCSLRSDGERLYGLNPVSKLLTNNNGVSYAPMCLMSNDRVYIQSWYHLKEAVLKGGVPFEKAHGMNVYEYLQTDERFSKIFNRAMSDSNAVTMKKVIETYKGFDGLINTVVDVGGGTGALLSMIVTNYPSIKAINFDLPHVIQNAPTYPGVEHVCGDMFVSVPQGDAIILKAVLHNWSDEQCVKVLKNCYDAISEKGKVIVIESLVSGDPSDTSLVAKRVARIDLIMMAHHPGGRERTSNEYEALAKDAGFKGFRVACDAFYANVMEFFKD